MYIYKGYVGRTQREKILCHNKEYLGVTQAYYPYRETRCDSVGAEPDPWTPQRQQPKRQKLGILPKRKPRSHIVQTFQWLLSLWNSFDCVYAIGSKIEKCLPFQTDRNMFMSTWERINVAPKP